jgi:nicotinate-nucleotide adenylyltransferase
VEESNVHKGPGYGILGGTFDPPHIGHLALAQEAHARLRLDRVWFIPAGQPPHKVGHVVSPAADRRAMVELAVADDQRFAVSSVELDRPGPSYTSETLRLLRAEWGAERRMCLILGWDMLTYLPHWHEPERVIATVDQIAAAHRPGVPEPAGELERLRQALPGLAEKLVILPAPELDVAATDLRERVASNLPIRYLVPDAVRAYVEAHHLYRSGPAPAEVE